MRGTERPPPLEGVTENGTIRLCRLQSGEGFPQQQNRNQKFEPPNHQILLQFRINNERGKMSENQDNPLSPTVSKVLDEYLATLEGDEDIDNNAAQRLDTLLRKGKVPKFEDIDEALSETEAADQA